MLWCSSAWPLLDFWYKRAVSLLSTMLSLPSNTEAAPWKIPSAVLFPAELLSNPQNHLERATKNQEKNCESNKNARIYDRSRCSPHSGITSTWSIVLSTQFDSMHFLETDHSRTIRPKAAETCPPTALRRAHKLQLLRTPVRLPAAVERPVQTPMLAIQEGVRAKTKVQTRVLRNRALG